MNGQGAKILVAEDDVSHRHLLVHLLERSGYDVCQASDGYVALHRMFQRIFDVVITDWEMPKLNGADFIRHSRIFWPNTPVIIVSAQTITFPSDIPEGAYAWIKKPYGSAELLRILHEAVMASLHHCGKGTAINPRRG